MPVDISVGPYYNTKGEDIGWCVDFSTHMGFRASPHVVSE